MRGRFSAWRRNREPAPKWGWALALMFAIAAPGIIWVFALYFNYGLASHACYPATAPRPSLPPAWRGLPTMLTVFNIVCFAIGASALALAALDWRRAAHAASAPTSSGERNQLASVTGSLALAAILGALILCFALFVNGLSLWLISRCALA